MGRAVCLVDFSLDGSVFFEHVTYRERRQLCRIHFHSICIREYTVQLKLEKEFSPITRQNLNLFDAFRVLYLQSLLYSSGLRQESSFYLAKM